METQTVETRAQHLEWCKKRALVYCDRGDTNSAAASFMSDMSKHPETEGHSALPFMMQMMLGGMLGTPTKMREFILGFN